MEQRIYGALIALVVVFGLNPTASAQSDGTFDEQEILKAATDFFGGTTAGLAKVIQKVFEDRGRPNGFIAGEEISGAFVVGLRYGNGTLNRKTDEPQILARVGPEDFFTEDEEDTLREIGALDAVLEA